MEFLHGDSDRHPWWWCNCHWHVLCHECMPYPAPISMLSDAVESYRRHRFPVIAWPHLVSRPDCHHRWQWSRNRIYCQQPKETNNWICNLRGNCVMFIFILIFGHSTCSTRTRTYLSFMYLMMSQTMIGKLSFSLYVGSKIEYLSFFAIFHSQFLSSTSKKQKTQHTSAYSRTLSKPTSRNDKKQQHCDEVTCQILSLGELS